MQSRCTPRGAGSMRRRGRACEGGARGTNRARAPCRVSYSTQDEGAGAQSGRGFPEAQRRRPRRRQTALCPRKPGNGMMQPSRRCHATPARDRPSTRSGEREEETRLGLSASARHDAGRFPSWAATIQRSNARCGQITRGHHGRGDFVDTRVTIRMSVRVKVRPLSRNRRAACARSHARAKWRWERRRRRFPSEGAVEFEKRVEGNETAGCESLQRYGHNLAAYASEAGLGAGEANEGTTKRRYSVRGKRPEAGREDVNA